jgi:hypothetical protein
LRPCAVIVASQEEREKGETSTHLAMSSGLGVRREREERDQHSPGNELGVGSKKRERRERLAFT